LRFFVNDFLILDRSRSSLIKGQACQVGDHQSRRWFFGVMDIPVRVGAHQSPLQKASSSVGQEWGSSLEPLDLGGDLHREHSALLSDAGLEYADLGAEKGFKADDVLLVIDMQNDFLPAVDAPLGGRFGVAEGGEASAIIIPLIHACLSAGGKVVATRDYHPKDHCSFMTNGGPFPDHCIQGSDGAKCELLPLFQKTA